MTSWFYTVADPDDEVAGGAVPITGDSYARMMRHLLPPSRLWRLDPAGLLWLTLRAAADELARVSLRASDLVEEADPRTASELLPDFERQLEIDAEGTEAERRARVVARLVRRQRFRPADYRTALAPLLKQDPADVVVIERSRADAIAMADDREIYRYFIYRDPGVAFGELVEDPADLEGAQSLVTRMEPAHTLGTVIESVDALCDDAFSLCDRDILGA